MRKTDKCPKCKSSAMVMGMNSLSSDERLARIGRAVSFQASDETLWNPTTIGAAHVTQSLRWLHELIETDSDLTLKSIKNQSEDRDE